MKRLLCVVGLGLFLLSVPACGRSDGDKDKDKGKGNDIQVAGTKVSLAFLSNNPAGFWTYAERGCQAAAKELDVKVTFHRPTPDTLTEQKRIIQDLMNLGVQGIAISPNDPGNFVTFLRDKVAPKLVLVAQDNDLPDPKARRCYIGTHNYQAGRAAGALVKKALPKGGKIAIFVGRMDSTNAVERRQGLLDYLAGKDQKEIGDKTPADAANHKVGDYVLIGTRTDEVQEKICKEKAQELLIVNPDLGCLIGLWEYNPPALLKAVSTLESKLEKRPAIVAFDENFQTLEAIQKGDIVGTVVQNPYQFGYESIKIMAALVKGDEGVLKNRKDIDDQNRIYIPHRVVVRNPGSERIDNSETIDVDVFYPQMKKLKSGE